PVSPQAIDAKRADGSKLQRDIQSEQANAQEAYALRQEALVGPVFADIGKAMQEYAKQNGYTMVFDLAQLAQSKMIIAVDNNADITDAFIKFYNARPAGSAAKTK
ncbi:MAG: OmpH family outer membrane protein, partial [Pyrinomonadaceae bacterium]|nr:OmpH family outer membrane protein [Pyrinomonadaceae bacterium]